MAGERRPLLVGCGILRKEVAYLIAERGWAMDTIFLDSSLHIDFDRLGRGLRLALAKHGDRERLVLYGCCHPQIDDMISEANAPRTEGQNCIEILLGHEAFSRELEMGAYFLLEDWALHWDRTTEETFGKNPEIVRNIFQSDRKYLLAITTPCSGDFAVEAQHASEQVGLPLRWMSTSLDHLASVLGAALQHSRSSHQNG